MFVKLSQDNKLYSIDTLNSRAQELLHIFLKFHISLFSFGFMSEQLR